MTTTKALVASISIVAVLGVAVATYQVRAAHLETTRLQQRLGDTESRLRQAEKRARAADEDNAKLLAEIASSPSPAVPSLTAPHTPQPDEITSQSVLERFSRGQALAAEGRFAEALTDYLWCYDIGMVKVPTLAGARVSGLRMRILELGEKYPPALAAFRERRDRSVQGMLAGGGDRGKSAASFAELNDALGESDRTLAAFDRLSPTDPQRQELATYLTSILLDAQRYRELVQAKPYAQMKRDLDAFIRALGIMGGMGMETKSAVKLLQINKTVQNIEALAGAGDLEHARELALKLLDFDSSATTQALLLAHMDRAGHPSLLATVSK